MRTMAAVPARPSSNPRTIDLARTKAALTAPLLFFGSGLAALVYQVLWIKQLSLIVGVDVYAVTIGVSAFFAGLAIGGAVFGRLADRIDRPIRLYCLLELGAAVLGVGATLALAVADRPFAGLEAVAGPLAWSLVILLVVGPAILLGGTFPVFVKVLEPTPDRIGVTGGRMYAANTTGAIAGALLASFLFIPALGLRGSACAAAIINLSVAAIAWWLFRGSRSEREAARDDNPVPPLTSDARTALALYAIAGGIALGYEVVWSQAIVQFMSTRAFAFSIVLATYLMGLALGASVAARVADRMRDPWAGFGVLIASAGLIALLAIAGIGRWLPVLQTQAEIAAVTMTGSALFGMCTRFAVAAVYILLIPTILLGAAFPLALRLIVGPNRQGRDIGAVLAVNTAGGIGGAVLTGLILIPVLGLIRTLAVLAVGAAGIGLYALRCSNRSRTPMRWTVAGMGAFAVVVLFLLPTDRLAHLLPGARTGAVAFYDESRGGTVAVIEQRTATKQFRRLYIQGVSNSGDAMTSLRYMRLQALLPLLIHRGEPRSALVVGFGTGITAGALLTYPTLEHRVVAELLPSVVRAAPQFQGNFHAASDSRIEIRLRDGRRELLRHDQRYDLITLEPPPPSAAGVVNLYSSDFYALAARRLNPDGLFAQWLPLPTQNDEDTRSLVRSFLDVFPQASLWTTEFHEALLIGSLSPIELDGQRIADRFRQPEVAQALAEVGIATPAALLATWMLDRPALERYVDGAPPVTDDRPRIEYATWVRPAEIANTLPRLLALRTAPPLTNADEAFIRTVARERERLTTFYSAGLHALAGDRASWARAMQRVSVEDAGNPYYRWIAGGALPSSNSTRTP